MTTGVLNSCCLCNYHSSSQKNKMHVILMHNDVLCTIIAFHHRHCKMKQTAVILVTLLSAVCIEGILLTRYCDISNILLNLQLHMSRSHLQAYHCKLQHHQLQITSPNFQHTIPIHVKTVLNGLSTLPMFISQMVRMF